MDIKWQTCPNVACLGGGDESGPNRATQPLRFKRSLNSEYSRQRQQQQTPSFSGNGFSFSGRPFDLISLSAISLYK
jgi:hypothetical protein